MRVSPALSRLTSRVVLPGFLFYATACHPWVTGTVPTQGQGLNEQPRVVRIVRSPPGSVMTLTDPVVIGDTLVGFAGTSGKRVRVAVPLSQVAALQTQEFSAVRTVLVLIPVVLVSLFIYGLSTLEP
ncbi:MAG: hypothetical protein M3P26_15155 [Gemmatimonadota bacterium]|nr:hypothetical protein [Gemmatimonadota bacterium]